MRTVKVVPDFASTPRLGFIMLWAMRIYADHQFYMHIYRIAAGYECYRAVIVRLLRLMSHE